MSTGELGHANKITPLGQKHIHKISSRQFWSKFVVGVIFIALLICYVSLAASPAVSAMCCMCILSVLLCTTIYTAAWVVSDIVDNIDPIALHRDKRATTTPQDASDSVDNIDPIGLHRDKHTPATPQDASWDGVCGFVVFCVVLVCFIICVIGTTINQTICTVAGGTILISVLLYGGYSFINMMSMYGTYDHTRVLGILYPNTHSIADIQKSIFVDTGYVRGAQNNIRTLNGDRVGGATGGGQGSATVLFYNPIDPIITNISHIQASGSNIGVVMYIPPEKQGLYFKDVRKYLTDGTINNRDYIRYATISTYAAARSRQDYVTTIPGEGHVHTLLPLAHHGVIPDKMAIQVSDKLSHEIGHEPITLYMRDVDKAKQAPITQYFIGDVGSLAVVFADADKAHITTMYIHIDGSLANHWLLYNELKNIMFTYNIKTVILYIPSTETPAPGSTALDIIGQPALREYHSRAKNEMDCAVVIAAISANIMPRANGSSRKTWADVEQTIQEHIKSINSIVKHIVAEQTQGKSPIIIGDIPSNDIRNMTVGTITIQLHRNIIETITKEATKRNTTLDQTKTNLTAILHNIKTHYAMDKHIGQYMLGYVSKTYKSPNPTITITDELMPYFATHSTEYTYTENYKIPPENQSPLPSADLVVLAWCYNMYDHNTVDNTIKTKLCAAIKQKADTITTISLTIQDRTSLHTYLDHTCAEYKLIATYIVIAYIKKLKDVIGDFHTKLKCTEINTFFGIVDDDDIDIVVNGSCEAIKTFIASIKAFCKLLKAHGNYDKYASCESILTEYKEPGVDTTAILTAIGKFDNSGHIIDMPKYDLIALPQSLPTHTTKYTDIIFTFVPPPECNIASAKLIKLLTNCDNMKLNREDLQKASIMVACADTHSRDVSKLYQKCRTEIQRACGGSIENTDYAYAAAMYTLCTKISSTERTDNNTKFDEHAKALIDTITNDSIRVPLPYDKDNLIQLITNETAEHISSIDEAIQSVTG